MEELKYYLVTKKLPKKEGRYLCKAKFEHSTQYDFLYFIAEKWWATAGNEPGNTDLTHRVIAWTDDYREKKRGINSWEAKHF